MNFHFTPSNITMLPADNKTELLRFEKDGNSKVRLLI